LREVLGIVKNALLNVVEEGLRSGKNANIDQKRRKLRFFMPCVPSKPHSKSPLSHENAKKKQHALKGASKNRLSGVVAKPARAHAPQFAERKKTERAMMRYIRAVVNFSSSFAEFDSVLAKCDPILYKKTRAVARKTRAAGKAKK
jgi:hypothetical protein